MQIKDNNEKSLCSPKLKKTILFLHIKIFPCFFAKLYLRVMPKKL